MAGVVNHPSASREEEVWARQRACGARAVELACRLVMSRPQRWRRSSRCRVRPLARAERLGILMPGNQGGTAEQPFVPVWMKGFLLNH